MKSTTTALSLFAAGAAFMYLADPDRGRRRRAIVRDKSVRRWHEFSSLADKARRDLANRSGGAVSVLGSMFRNGRTGDAALVQRVKTKIGRLVSHPHAIEAHAVGGRVALRGAVLAAEVDALLRGVRGVRGVNEVIDELEPHENGEHVSSLQGGSPRGSRAELLQQNWTPALRMTAGGIGSCLMLYGLRKSGVARMASSAAGMGLLTRAVANREWSDITGTGRGARGVEFDKVVHIQAPVAEVFAFWSDYTKFPRFMTHLKEVRDAGNGRSHWVAEGPAGIAVSWEAEVTRTVPNRLLEWRSVEGSRIETEGSVRFDENANGGTRVTIRMSYRPPAGMLGRLAASLFGADPKSEMDDDMTRLKSLIERGRTRAHGMRVTREEIQVQESS